MPLQVRYRDVFRATLADDCGNVGYLGLAPDGSAYHVVVPVDAQIARGIKAGNRPDDGTPFGGYRDWLYFCCRTFPATRPELRESQTRENARLLEAGALTLGIELEFED